MCFFTTRNTKYRIYFTVIEFEIDIMQNSFFTKHLKAMGVVVKNWFFDVKNDTILPTPIKPVENILHNHFKRVYCQIFG